MGVLQAVWLFVRGAFAGRAVLMAENLALREQLILLHRSAIRRVRYSPEGRRLASAFSGKTQAGTGRQPAMPVTRKVRPGHKAGDGSGT